MIPVETKKMPNGKWSCFATFDCYDHAFVTESKGDSQEQMKEQLRKSGLEGHGLFMKEVIHQPRESKPSYKWQPPFIYFNPIG